MTIAISAQRGRIRAKVPAAHRLAGKRLRFLHYRETAAGDHEFTFANDSQADAEGSQERGGDTWMWTLSTGKMLCIDCGQSPASLEKTTASLHVFTVKAGDLKPYRPQRSRASTHRKVRVVRAASAPIQQTSEPFGRLRDAVRFINQMKTDLGDDLNISTNSDGKLAVMVEYN